MSKRALPPLSANRRLSSTKTFLCLEKKLWLASSATISSAKSLSLDSSSNSRDGQSKIGHLTRKVRRHLLSRERSASVQLEAKLIELWWLRFPMSTSSVMQPSCWPIRPRTTTWVWHLLHALSRAKSCKSSTSCKLSWCTIVARELSQRCLLRCKEISRSHMSSLSTTSRCP